MSNTAIAAISWSQPCNGRSQVTAAALSSGWPTGMDGDRMPERARNWAGNVEFSAARLHRPRSVAELQELVSTSMQVRALGTGHSFSRIADSPGALVSLAGLPPVIAVRPGAQAVTVGAGVRYGELAEHLHTFGLALPNLASLPHVSVAGACATATHGSGDACGNLATAVSSMEIVGADGELSVVGRNADSERFLGTVVGLGGLGITTRLTLDVVPAFDLRQYVYTDLPADVLRSCFNEIFASAYSVSVFTDWQGSLHNQVWLKCRSDESDRWQPERRWMGARLAEVPMHPISGMPPDCCTQQLGVPGPWFERLPHFRPDFTPSTGNELQSEYLVSRELTAEALDAITDLHALIAPVLAISEIRTVAADALWLSPSYQRPTVGLHFTWINEPRAVAPVIAAIEERLAPLGARPHWAKLFRTPAQTVRQLYERYADFGKLLSQHDPAGKFRNEFIDHYFPAAS